MSQISTGQNRSISSLAIIVMILGIAVWAVTSIVLFKKPAWGTFMHNFVFFTVVAQSAFAIAVAVRLASGKWGSPSLRLGSTINLAFMPIAIIGLIIVFANQGSIHFWAAEPDKHIWFNPLFFIVRNALYFAIFYGLSYRLNKLIRIKGSAADDSIQHRIIMNGFFLLITFVAGMTIFSWDMSMTLNHGYADTIYGLQFIVSGLHGGLALVVLLMTLSGRLFNVESFPQKTYSFGAQLQLALCIIWFYAWWSQFFPTWYAHIPEETHSLFFRAQGQYLVIYVAAMFLSAVIPFISLLFTRVRESKTALSGVSLIILTGLWLERYLQTNPALDKYMKETVTVVHIFNPINILFGAAVLGAFMFSLMRLLKKSPDAIPLEQSDPSFEQDRLIAKPRGW